MSRRTKAFIALVGLFVTAGDAAAQSSSLYVDNSVPAVPRPASQSYSPDRPVDRLSPAVAQASLVAAKIPEPRKYALHDLVTIIVRESNAATADSTLDTSHENNINGELSNFPNIPILQTFLNGVANTNLTQDPKLNLAYKNEFKGSGDYSRTDTSTSRITGEIIDVKPNGTLVIEARKFTKTDKEILMMSLTGTCRKEDIANDNTVLSTQIFDLRLSMEHKGEVRGGNKKGLFTKVIESLISF